MKSEREDLDPRLAARLRAFAEPSLGGFDADRVATAATKTQPPRQRWGLGLIAAAGLLGATTAVALMGALTATLTGQTSTTSPSSLPLGTDSPTASAASEVVPTLSASAVPTPSATGLTEAQAIGIAIAAAPHASDLPAVSAKAGPASELVPSNDPSADPPPDRWVWVVVFSSGQPLEGEIVVVVLDYLDGGVYDVMDLVG